MATPWRLIHVVAVGILPTATELNKDDTKGQIQRDGNNI